jgi:hypothetical protein
MFFEPTSVQTDVCDRGGGYEIELRFVDAFPTRVGRTRLLIVAGVFFAEKAMIMILARKFGGISADGAISRPSADWPSGI